MEGEPTTYSGQEDVAAFFDNLDPAAGDVLIATGWALAEDLEKLA